MSKYRLAVRWIADNDEPMEEDLETLSSMISVQLVADVFSRPPKEVARDVLRARRRPDPEWEPTPLRRRRV